MLLRARWLLAAFSVASSSLLAAACGGASTVPAEPTADPSEDGAPAADAPAPASEAGAPAAAAPAPAAPARDARDADTSDPDGLPKISTEDRKALETECKKFSDAVAKSVGKKKLAEGETRNDQVLAALESPVKVAGVDAPKCADLMRREIVIYTARQAESEAKNNLKLIAVNLGVAFEDGKKLCPAAGPTPASLEAFKNGRVATTPNDWMAPGWSCVRFGPSTTPTRWQYELKTDKGAGTWQVIARGYPVAGGPEAELFLPGVIDASGVTPPGSVKRR